MRIIRKQLTYANVMSTLAIFIVLGGAAYAATLPANSVGNRQIQAFAVSTSKLVNGSVIATKLPAQAISTSRYRNSSIIGSKVQDGTLTAADLSAATLSSLKLTDRLPSGVTLRGRYLARFTSGSGGGDIGGTSISFGFSLANAPTPVFVAKGTTQPNCPGNATTPSANAGFLCVYEAVDVNHNGVSLTNSSGSPATAETYGAGVQFSATAAGNSQSSGSWAVTAP